MERENTETGWQNVSPGSHRSQEQMGKISIFKMLENLLEIFMN